MNKKIRVLITDDEAELCDKIKNVLEQGWDNYVISAAYSGTEAISCLEKVEFDVLVTDIRMPGMSGIELMEKSNQIREDLQTIILTGHGDIDNAIEALRLGANNYLKKPVSAEVLHFAIMNAWEKKELNRKLRESEAQFRSMFEQNDASMLLTDPDTGDIVNANMASSEFYGYSLSELTGMNIRDINMLPEEQFGEDMRHVKSGRKKTLIFPHRLKNGKVRTVEAHFTPLEIHDKHLHFSIIHDIEERRQAEKALRESERRYRTLFDSASDAIFVHYFDGQIFDVNQAACERLGYDREELMQTVPKDFTSPEYAALTSKRMEELREKGHIVFESAQVRRNGEVIPVEESSRIIEYGGKKAVLTISRDIHERKKAEEEKKRLQEQIRQFQKMESIGTLAGGIAHDFNNILYSIIGYIDLTMDDVPRDGVIRSNLEQVLKASYRARGLVKQILTFSQQESRERVPLKIQYIIEEVLNLLRITLSANIEIRHSIKECGSILADSSQMHQVVMNLCINAYHAVDEKGGVITVLLNDTELGADDIAGYPDIEPGRYLRFSISDTGHGMDRKIMERIFDPYFTTKEQGKGSGLGLSVVHGIVKGHDGYITVCSEPGKGTAFHVYLPLISDPENVSEILPDKPLPRGNERVLLVDDEEQIVEMARQMLEKLGYNITALTNSVEALDAFRSHPENFDIVITDTTMPHMSGVELSEAILRIRPEIPIILCTGFSEFVTKDEVKAMGIREFVVKPVIRSDIAKAIRQALD
ncbi:response regulator [Desulfobacterales bacterium HSG2]|nr:response regulator [Desulfobacterales bacterium HSG2]